MAESPSLTKAVAVPSSEQDLPALTIDEEYILCNWDTIPRECIPGPNRPCGPLTAAVTNILSMLSLIVPGHQGLSAVRRLVTATIHTRIEESDVDTLIVQEQDMQKTLNDMHSLLSAVSDIVKARRENAELLRKHGFRSEDPFEWPPRTVMVLWDLVKQTGKDFSRGNEAGRYLGHHYEMRIQKDRNSPRMIIESDVTKAIESLNNASTPDNDTAPNAGSEEPTTSSENTNVKQHFCTTGTIFRPSLPPLDVLVGIGKIYYNAKKQNGVQSKSGPLIMSYEVACKGMYHDNVGSKKLFGKRFCEIFECLDIQADQALRVAENVLVTLNSITRHHRRISNVETLHKVLDDFFTKFPRTEKLRSLTSDGIKMLSDQLDAAAVPNAQGVKYAGWPSLSGDAAGPAIPLEDPTVKQTRRRNREVSPANSSEQPTTKKPRPGLTMERRASYVSSHVPEADPLVKDRNPNRRSSGPSFALASMMLQKDLTKKVESPGLAADRTAGTNFAPTLTSTSHKTGARNRSVRGKRTSIEADIDRPSEESGDTGIQVDPNTEDEDEDAPVRTSATHFSSCASTMPASASRMAISLNNSARDNGKNPSTHASIEDLLEDSYEISDDAAIQADVTVAEGSHSGPSASQSVSNTIRESTAPENVIDVAEEVGNNDSSESEDAETQNDTRRALAAPTLQKRASDSVGLRYDEAQQFVADTTQETEWESSRVVDQLSTILQSVQEFAHSNLNRVKDMGDKYLTSEAEARATFGKADGMQETCEKLQARAEGAEKARDDAQLLIDELEQKLQRAEEKVNEAVEMARQAEQRSKTTDREVEMAKEAAQMAEKRAKETEKELMEKVAEFHRRASQALYVLSEEA